MLSWKTKLLNTKYRYETVWQSLIKEWKSMGSDYLRSQEYLDFLMSQFSNEVDFQHCENAVRWIQELADNKVIEHKVVLGLFLDKIPTLKSSRLIITCLLMIRRYSTASDDYIYISKDERVQLLLADLILNDPRPYELKFVKHLIANSTNRLYYLNCLLTSDEAKRFEIVLEVLEESKWDDSQVFVLESLVQYMDSSSIFYDRLFLVSVNAYLMLHSARVLEIIQFLSELANSNLKQFLSMTISFVLSTFNDLSKEELLILIDLLHNCSKVELETYGVQNSEKSGFIPLTVFSVLPLLEYATTIVIPEISSIKLQTILENSYMRLQEDNRLTFSSFPNIFHSFLKSVTDREHLVSSYSELNLWIGSISLFKHGITNTISKINERNSLRLFLWIFYDYKKVGNIKAFLSNLKAVPHLLNDAFISTKYFNLVINTFRGEDLDCYLLLLMKEALLVNPLYYEYFKHVLMTRIVGNIRSISNHKIQEIVSVLLLELCTNKYEDYGTELLGFVFSVIQSFTQMQNVHRKSFFRVMDCLYELVLAEVIDPISAWNLFIDPLPDHLKQIKYKFVSTFKNIRVESEPIKLFLEFHFKTLWNAVMTDADEENIDNAFLGLCAFDLPFQRQFISISDIVEVVKKHGRLSRKYIIAYLNQEIDLFGRFSTVKSSSTVKEDNLILSVKRFIAQNLNVNKFPVALLTALTGNINDPDGVMRLYFSNVVAGTVVSSDLIQMIFVHITLWRSLFNKLDPEFYKNWHDYFKQALKSADTSVKVGLLIVMYTQLMLLNNQDNEDWIYRHLQGSSVPFYEAQHGKNEFVQASVILSLTLLGKKHKIDTTCVFEKEYSGLVVTFMTGYCKSLMNPSIEPSSIGEWIGASSTTDDKLYKKALKLLNEETDTLLLTGCFYYACKYAIKSKHTSLIYSQVLLPKFEYLKSVDHHPLVYAYLIPFYNVAAKLGKDLPGVGNTFEEQFINQVSILGYVQSDLFDLECHPDESKRSIINEQFRSVCDLQIQHPKLVRIAIINAVVYVSQLESETEQDEPSTYQYLGESVLSRFITLDKDFVMGTLLECDKLPPLNWEPYTPSVEFCLKHLVSETVSGTEKKTLKHRISKSLKSILLKSELGPEDVAMLHGLLPMKEYVNLFLDYWSRSDDFKHKLLQSLKSISPEFQELLLDLELPYQMSDSLSKLVSRPRGSPVLTVLHSGCAIESTKDFMNCDYEQWEYLRNRLDSVSDEFISGVIDEMILSGATNFKPLIVLVSVNLKCEIEGEFLLFYYHRNNKWFSKVKMIAGYSEKKFNWIE